MRLRNRFHGTPAELQRAKAHWGQVFRDNAECWWREQGKFVPPQGTTEYRAMYNAWVDYTRND
jgi:hypothetical protein